MTTRQSCSGGRVKRQGEGHGCGEKGEGDTDEAGFVSYAGGDGSPTSMRERLWHRGGDGTERRWLIGLCGGGDLKFLSIVGRKR